MHNRSFYTGLRAEPPGIRYFVNEFENAIYRLGNQLCVRVSIMRTIECCFCQCGNDDFYNYWLEEALRHTHYAMRYHATNVQESIHVLSICIFNILYIYKLFTLATSTLTLTPI